MVKYYRGFWSWCTAIMFHLTALTNLTAISFHSHWKPEHFECFKCFKEMIAQDILFNTQIQNPYLNHTDAHNYQLGSVFYQDKGYIEFLS